MKNLLTSFFTLSLFLPWSVSADTIFVDTNATGTSDGSSWTNAFNHLQDALVSASPEDEIWVSRGTYYPDEGMGQTDNDPSSTFQLKNGVTLYGGFGGGETSLSQRVSQRIFSRSETILSGDLDQNDGPDFC